VRTGKPKQCLSVCQMHSALGADKNLNAQKYIGN